MKSIYSLTLCGFLSLVVLLGTSSCSSTRTAAPRPIPAARAYTPYNDYINRYAPLALDQQRKHGIPASIKLAQGILESGAGKSKLAKEANNHFGIKCHRSWTGGRSYHNDDLPNECFRAYDTVEESFLDHSYFLKQKRYQRLFKLKITDYKGWARGLQECGYATNKGYANALIKLIEDNRLYLIDKENPKRLYTYDAPSKSVAPQPKKQQPKKEKRGVHGERPAYIGNELLYTIVQQGETLADIAREMEMSERKLAKHNDFPEGYPLTPGDIVYLQPKRSKAVPPHYEHVVKVGESIHQIAQTYGIKISALYALNRLSEEYVPNEGDVLLLR
ncbi:glucosaminidase domain-containing protein [Porphyromonas cangingivalis]|uniref:Peptidoglycan hydrolase n=1 Tax=Porphyromonas cangingivalis TaxID=36874 RepID=A0A1T4JSJ2_PORCN|nr:glucosaminidase domain-containing protein [Porphyromonas cangingivalis]SJZ33074.1 Flagellum-specific peptidoglycan hydrolase FlgJ [Porphyromonas cangingivalis]VEJ04699.1 Exo-glucosaminidase lytG precursor [Porphyromonas cangingivalis]